MILLLALACNDNGNGDTYDVHSWQSPLASQADEPGDTSVGEAVFYEETWGDAWGFTCNSCHSSDSADTLTEDADELNRAGHTTWNAPWRASWKAGQAWDDTESEVIGAYGGQVCIKAYWPDGAEMTPQQAADLEAFMRTQMDDEPAEDDPRAQPLDFGFTSWDSQDETVAAMQDGEDWLAGDDLGDPVNGEAVGAEHCGSCHGDGSGGLSLTVPHYDHAGQLTSRIRKVDIGDIERPNNRMPRLPEDRLSDEDLLDLLAYLTGGPAE